MSESSLNGIKLATVVAAAALLFRDTAAFSFPGGLTLLLILFAFDSEAKSLFQSFAFAAVGGFAAAVAFLPFYPALLGSLNLGFPPIYLVWFVALLAIFLIDRVRSGSTPAAAPRLNTAFAPVTPAYQPAPPPPPPPVVRPEPTQPHLVRDEAVMPPPMPPTPAPTVAAPVPAAGAIPLKGGKQVDIYVNLLGEGMNMLRSVKAESLGRDFYHIIDVMPENERWEFTPGQVVRCQKKNLSSGKAFVAVEEAPRAQ